MTNDARETLDQIRKLAPELNAATDAANAIVARVEKFLNEECSIGLPCSRHASSSDAGENLERRVYLAYARCDGKFRIAVRSLDVYNRTGHLMDRDGSLDEIRSESVTPWASCPRDVKLETFVKLPELLKEIARVAGETMQKTKQAEGTVREILEALEPPAATPVQLQPDRFVHFDFPSDPAKRAALAELMKELKEASELQPSRLAQSGIAMAAREVGAIINAAGLKAELLPPPMRKP